MNKNKFTLESMLKDCKKYIPKGNYCYFENGENCPFWELKTGEYPSGEDGYCHYLKKSDWDLNEIYQESTILLKSKDCKECEGKSVKELYEFGVDPASNKKRHFQISLLWDECKECGVNLDE